MYTILFHLCGITILEICFFFYYIGPIETEMFKHHVQVLMNEPLKYIINLQQVSTPMPTIISDTSDTSFDVTNNDNISNYIQEFIFYNEQNNSNMNNTLLQDSNDSKTHREKENYNLFMTTIEYWCIFALFSLCVFFIQYKYTEYQKLQKNRGLTIIDNTNNRHQIELIGLQSNDDESYRKGSIDESDDETNIILGIPSTENNTYMKNKKNYYRNKIIHYITFGSLVIAFQYLFFQYIVYYYNPLTIDEIRYLIYKDLEPIITKT